MQSAFEVVLSLAVLACVVTVLWTASCTGALRYDVSSRSETAQFLDRAMREVRDRPYGQLARTRGSEKESGPLKLEYSVRRKSIGDSRKKRDVLEIQAAVIDRRKGTTVDRIVTWRARNERPR